MSTKNYSDFGIEIPSGRNSGKVKCFCPKCHNDRRDRRDKSLSVDLDKGVWKCHYCDWTGTVNASDFDDSPEGKRRWMEAQPWWKSAVKRPAPERRYATPKVPDSLELSDRLVGWFAARGISRSTLSIFAITEGEEWMPQKEKKVNTIHFNYQLDGHLVNIKYRTADKCFKMCKDARLIPYHIDAIKGEPECVITEGEIDAMSFVEAGFTAAVSVPAGANANLSFLDDFIDEWFEDKRVIYIAADTDEKGLTLRRELLRRFGPERCRLVDFGEGCKDANEHLVKFGPESLRATLDNAREIKLDGVFELRDFEDELDSIYTDGLQPGATIGHPDFDALCSFETKRLCVVTGIPGSGKSEFIDEIAVRLNLRHDWRFAYFSPENAPLAYHGVKLIEKLTGSHFDSMSLRRSDYEAAKNHINDNFSFICPKDDFRLSTILECGRYLVRRRGIKALVIDPFNRLDSENPGISETNYISAMLDSLTRFAQVNDVMVILMAHPTKQSKIPGGSIEAPTLYDISGSAHFFNKADYGLVVHRDRSRDVVEVNVQKVKFRHLGSTGSALFKYNLTNGRYVTFRQGESFSWDNTSFLEPVRQ